MLPGSSETSSIISDLEVGTLISLIFSILNGFLGLQTEKKLWFLLLFSFCVHLGVRSKCFTPNPFLAKGFEF
jgi:hypothetical protein